jgi:3-oxoadipate CoA-transferase beta subunit
MSAERTSVPEGRTEQPLTRVQIAQRVARDIPDSWYVNVGIGIPTLVPNWIPADREVIFHSENGLLGLGAAPPADQVDPWLINASKEHVTLVKGAALMHHADSFALIRGGHLDLCVLGAFEVSEQGDIANWAISEQDAIPAVGGAMDLVAGARRTWVAMEHTTREGRPRLVRQCKHPLTARRVVSRIYTNLAVLDVTPKGLRVLERASGVSMDALEHVTEARIYQ